MPKVCRSWQRSRLCGCRIRCCEPLGHNADRDGHSGFCAHTTAAWVKKGVLEISKDLRITAREGLAAVGRARAGASNGR